MDKRRRKNSETLGSVLSSMAELGSAVRIGEVTRALSECLPPAWRAEIGFVSLRDKVLFLRVENPVLLQEIGLGRGELLRELNQRLGCPVGDIVLKLGPLDAKTTPLPPCPLPEEPLPEPGPEVPVEAVPLARAIARLARRRGDVICPDCGATFDNKTGCQLCYQVKGRILLDAERLLVQQPWISREQFVKRSGLTTEEAEKIRKDLLIRVEKALKRLADPAGGKPGRRRLKEKILLWQSLRGCKLSTRPDPEEIRRGLNAVDAEQIIRRLWPAEKD